MNDCLQPGQKIFIRLRGEDRTYLADILEVSSRKVTISTPRFREESLACRSGDEMMVIYAACGGRFMFGTKVLALEADRLVIGPPNQAVPAQERLNVRLPVRFDVELTDSGGREVLVPAKNLSSGGLQVLSERGFAVGNTLKVRLTLPGDPPLPIETAAKVVWLEKVLDDGRMVNRLGITFLKPAIWQQDEIFRYIFRRMIEERQMREGGKR